MDCHSLLQCVKVKSLSRVRLLATPWTASNQAPPSMGFSRQEYWSGLPFPSPTRESEVAQSCPTLSDPMDCKPTRLLRPWDFPGKSTGVGCHCLLREGALGLKFSSDCPQSFPNQPTREVPPGSEITCQGRLKLLLLGLIWLC